MDQQDIKPKPDPEGQPPPSADVAIDGSNNGQAATVPSTQESTDSTGSGEDKEDQQLPASTEEKVAPPKCAKCGRKWARKGCTVLSCLTCCDDHNCATHNEVREKEKWREQVLAGTTAIQLKAKEIRGKAIPKGRFKETDFAFLGDTVVIWDLKQYLANPNWREDAIRKSKKRKARQLNDELSNTNAADTTVTKKMNRKKRFHQTMEGLYQKTLETK